MSKMATAAPSRARRRQMARPIPEAAPVITAFLPESPIAPLLYRARLEKGKSKVRPGGRPAAVR